MEKIKDLIQSGQVDQAIMELKAYLAENPEDDQAWYMLGRAYWRLDRHGEAISAYKHAVAINPESPASVALQMAGDVMDFFNPDMLNP